MSDEAPAEAPPPVVEEGEAGPPPEADAEQAPAEPADVEESAAPAEGSPDGAADVPAPEGDGVPPPEGDAAPDGAQGEGAPQAEGEAVAGEGQEGEGPPADGEAATAGEGGEGGEGGEAPTGEGEGGEQSPPEPAGPPPPPPVNYDDLEPLPEDYVPVKDLPPLPLPYRVDEEGKKLPLEGVESMFLTGSTLELVGLLGLGKESGQLTCSVTKEKLLHDVQFRGAISDFHAYKAKIQDADYDPIVFRINEDDIYGDGNNFEVALSHSAAELWESIVTEAAWREELQKLEALHKAAEKAKPRSKRVRVVKPWQSYGSEVDIEEASVRQRRDLIRIVIQRKRKDFKQAFKLADKDAHELWNSSQMECRPFKDPNFDMRKMEQEVGIQSVAATAEVAVQASGMRPRPNACQYQPRDLPPDEKQELLASEEMARFLENVRPLCEEALIQNEVTNIFEDDFSALSEEDGLSGNRKESIVTEYQSFTHLTYSKNKIVNAVQWLPHRKGVVAVACTEALSHSERVARAGRPANAHILIWNFKDPIHPEYVLQAPFEVMSFQYNPCNPEIVAGGMFNGQLVLWDTSNEHERIARMKQMSNKEDQNDETAIPIVKYKYLSAVEFSHHSAVADLTWLQGVEISSRGKLTKLGDGSKECSFVATVAGDGKVDFWDIRVEKLMKKGRRADDLLDMVWKPIHSVHLISLLGMDLGGSCFCFDMKRLEDGLVYVGSGDGELVYAGFIKPDGEENPDYSKGCIQAHVGSIVSLNRSPFFEDIILSVGDWSFQVWKEGQQAPIFQSGYAEDYYTAGCWSPTRPAVLYLVDQSGNLEIWDMLDRSHEPSIRVTLASTPFRSISFNVPGGSSTQQASNQFLALGDSAGTLRILELPRNLRRAVPNEKKLMGQFLEREMARVTDVGSRKPLRETALKDAEERKKEEEAAKEAAAQAAAMGMATRDTPNSKDQTSSNTSGKKGAPPVEVVDEKAEAEYLKLERRFKVQLGLISEEEAAISARAARS